MVTVTCYQVHDHYVNTCISHSSIILHMSTSSSHEVLFIFRIVSWFLEKRQFNAIKHEIVIISRTVMRFQNWGHSTNIYSISCHMKYSQLYSFWSICLYLIDSHYIYTVKNIFDMSLFILVFILDKRML